MKTVHIYRGRASKCGNVVSLSWFVLPWLYKIYWSFSKSTETETAELVPPEGGDRIQSSKCRVLINDRTMNVSGTVIVIL
jgi:hypothetical protein